jgi:hypothetical protein
LLVLAIKLALAMALELDIIFARCLHFSKASVNMVLQQLRLHLTLDNFIFGDFVVGVHAIVLRVPYSVRFLRHAAIIPLMP